MKTLEVEERRGNTWRTFHSIIKSISSSWATEWFIHELYSCCLATSRATLRRKNILKGKFCNTKNYQRRFSSLLHHFTILFWRLNKQVVYDVRKKNLISFPSQFSAKSAREAFSVSMKHLWFFRKSVWKCVADIAFRSAIWSDKFDSKFASFSLIWARFKQAIESHLAPILTFFLPQFVADKSERKFFRVVRNPRFIFVHQYRFQR